MKRILALILCLMCMLLCACSKVTLREATSCRYTPEYNELYVEYVHCTDPDDGESYDIRKEYYIHHVAVYEIQYKITRSNGNVSTEWETVTKEEYTNYLEATQ